MINNYLPEKMFRNAKNFMLHYDLFLFINISAKHESEVDTPQIGLNGIKANTSTPLAQYRRNFQQKKNTLKRRIRTRIVKIRRTRKIPKSTKPSLNVTCGVPIILSAIENLPLYRIINGYTTSVFSWPWIASIHDENNDHICAATIVSQKYLLTAAHCVRDHGFREYTIKLGIDQSTHTKKEYTFQIDVVYIHPDYDDGLKHDLAIIKLNENIEFSPVARPICLPPVEKGDLPLERNVVVIGWGSTTVINQQMNNQCSKELKNLYCALDPTPKKSNICYGDSGGPMMIYHENAWHLFGISNFLTGFSAFKCDNARPSYYANFDN
ncbi:chymotrypsinogen 2-like [Brachionus plicatilis]|uniref:Chymotrypsinogen 2-like n=1 Tax=Brachionus plicatilis TaxID=10195 RepID=A0A3M7Q8Y3_BRAPC|nr:chymotrypsinogen 2-like [Brachionus plicatilis]